MNRKGPGVPVEFLTAMPTFSLLFVVLYYRKQKVSPEVNTDNRKYNWRLCVSYLKGEEAKWERKEEGMERDMSTAYSFIPWCLEIRVADRIRSYFNAKYRVDSQLAFSLRVANPLRNDNVQLPGKAATNQYCIHEETKRRLSSGNVYYHSVQNRVPARLLCKSVQSEIYE